MLNPEDKEYLSSYDVIRNQKEGKSRYCENAHAKCIEEQGSQPRLSGVNEVKTDRKNLKGRGRVSAGPRHQETSVCLLLSAEVDVQWEAIDKFKKRSDIAWFIHI